jgi:beta-1,4-N-acetylglucosaminyltransferase
MIFVTTGTNEAPFDRLLRAVGQLARQEETVVQYGSSSLRPEGASCVAFLPFDELVEHVRRARVVVTHAGAGSILVGLVNGKRPVVLPRCEPLGEAVDDHQLVFGRRLATLGLITLIEDEGLLAEAVARENGDNVSSGAVRAGGELAGELRGYLAGLGLDRRERSTRPEGNS